MPRTHSLAWAQLKFGIIAVFALIMAGMLIFAVGGGSGMPWQNYSLKARFGNVAGLMAGSPVRVAGVQVGTVDRVILSDTGVEVWFTVKNEYQALVTDRSNAVLGSISLLGEGAVDISAGIGGTPVPEWGYVNSGVAEGSIAQLTTEATAGLNEAKLLISDLRAGKGTVGKLFTDDTIYREFESFVQAAERVARNVSDGKGTIGKFANDPKMYNELEASLANLNVITGKLRSGEGSLGQLMNDPALAKSLNQTSSNLEAMTGRLNRGEGTAGKLLNDDALYQRIDSMTARLDTVLQQLNDGQGTAGQLLHDKQLYENMNGAVAEIKALIAEIKKDPKKYLNVKVSIF
ncbi:MAG: MlaD family protein [Acidobacteriota bacterium]|nr:MlaD family protein [Acidobacteriota bacterium]MDP3718484.1 MlaD family protein [Acidobacteriota bacterium]